MSKFTDNLWSDLATEHGASLAQAQRPEPGRARRPRPRILAGSTLGLAGVGTALILALGGSAAAPAFAITRSGDGSVQVQLSYAKYQTIGQVNAKLAAMGTGERITIYMASGPAAVPGPVTCTPAPGTSGPTVTVLDGTNGTEVIKAGESAGNTAEGTFHLNHCIVSNNSGNSGNSGNG